MSKQKADGIRPPVLPVEIDPSQRPMLRRYRSWRRFHLGPRQSGEPLLKNLNRYPNAVLVAGCQRSGTTMLTRIIARSAGFRGLSLTDDDELDAALALNGQIDLPLDVRYCLQTTYLNERYLEYQTLGPGHRLIWVLRNPQSVVYSMVFNWRRFALNELYEGCGVALATTDRLRRSGMPWPWGPSRIEKGCLSYSAKIAHIEWIRQVLPAHQVFVVDYDELVRAPGDWLPRIFHFIGEPYLDAYAAAVRVDSVAKAMRLSATAKSLIASQAEPIYSRCLTLVSRQQLRG